MDQFQHDSHVCRGIKIGKERKISEFLRVDSIAKCVQQGLENLVLAHWSVSFGEIEGLCNDALGYKELEVIF